ncbi:MAG: hypothetical protein FJX80_01990 [Bacteroidetes bacterium]|nr:hypothetical protein [Bacteroidota bacterium]
MKELFSYIVKVTKEIEKTESKEENGQKITVTQKVKEEVPVKIIIKQPSRKNLEDAELQFSIELSSCIKKGILTKGMLTKKYSDTGGMLSEEDAKELIALYNKITQYQNELLLLTSKSDYDKQVEAEIINKITTTRMRMVQVESLYRTLFDNTADNIAQNNVIRWFCVHMAHTQVMPEGDIEPMFKGSTTEQKLESLHLMDENEDEVYNKAYRKLATFMSFWFFSKNAKREDFEKLENDIETGKFEEQ